jgi:hypothetical protein
MTTLFDRRSAGDVVQDCEDLQILQRRTVYFGQRGFATRRDNSRYRTLEAPLVRRVARRLTDNGIAALFWLSRSIASVKVLCAGLHTTVVDSVVIPRLLYCQGYAGNRDVS